MACDILPFGGGICFLLVNLDGLSNVVNSFV